jgi:hypothetical protein
MVDLGWFAVFLLITGGIAAGVVAAVVHTWSLRALAFSLSTRLDVVEGTLSREVKARAGQERWKQPAKLDQELQAALAAVKTTPAKKLNWWERPDLPRSVEGHGVSR